MTYQHSVAVHDADSSIRWIKRFVSEKWPTLESDISAKASALSKRIQFSVTRPTDRPIDNRDACMYLATAECCIEQSRSLKSAKLGRAESSDILRAMPPVDLCCLLIAWQQSQVILEYDDSLAEALLSKDLDANLDVNAGLSHLPYDCFYVSSRKLKVWDYKTRSRVQAKGFFVNRVWIPTTETKSEHYSEECIAITFVNDQNGYLSPIILSTHASDYDDLMSRCIDEARKAMVRTRFDEQYLTSLMADLQDAIKLLLYIASEKPDIEQLDLYSNFAANTTNSLNKTSECNDDRPVDNSMTLFRIGQRAGRALRGEPSESETEAEQKRLAAHIRRGHYHTYIIGSKSDGSQKRIVKWVEPIAVNTSNDGTKPMHRYVKEMKQK